MLGWNFKVNCPNWCTSLIGGMFTEAQFSFLERYSYKCHGWQVQNTESLTLNEERRVVPGDLPRFSLSGTSQFPIFVGTHRTGSDLPDLGRPLGWAAFSLFFLLAISRWSPARAWPQGKHIFGTMLAFFVESHSGAIQIRPFFCLNIHTYHKWLEICSKALSI